MPVFYRGPGATITHKAITVPRLYHEKVALEDLEWVQATEEGPGPEVGRTRFLGAAAMTSVLVTVPVLGQESALLAVIVGAASLAYAGACLRIRPEVRFQLLAQIKGQVVVLFETADRAEFWKVCRAMQRASEFRSDTS